MFGLSSWVIIDNKWGILKRFIGIWKLFKIWRFKGVVLRGEDEGFCENEC